MRTRILKALTVLVFGLAFAQGNPAQVMKSSEALVGALGSTFSLTMADYIPSYGLQVNAYESGSEIDSQAFLDTTTEVLVGIGSLVKGLEPTDFISVSYTLNQYDDVTYFTVRLVPGKPESYEVFINGTKQE